MRLAETSFPHDRLPNWAGRRLGDHSVDDGGTFWSAGARSLAGSDFDGGGRGGSGGTMVAGPAARCVGKLRNGFATLIGAALLGAVAIALLLKRRSVQLQ